MKNDPITTPGAPRPRGAARDSLINIRVPGPRRDLIDLAASALGKTRTEFVLESACREAEAVLLDRRLFAVDGETWARFTTALDAPPSPSAALRKLLAAKAPWQR